MLPPPDYMLYTLCFLTRPDWVLMLYRRRPPNQWKWNGVGGHLETGETPLQGVLREVQEETGYKLETAQYRGILTWSGFEIPPGGLYLFTAAADLSLGEPPDEIGEGRLAWKPLEFFYTDDDVVSNLQIVGPLLMNGAPPQEYHFKYRRGLLVGYKLSPLPEWACSDC
jgi:8-oxo-dGTP diphosphatase